VSKPEIFRELGAELIIEDRLNYLDEHLSDYPEQLGFLREFLLQHIGKEDIIHFHNLNLGKNPLLTAAISELAGRGYRVLNHAHDFAEDRPANMAFLSRVIVNGLGMSLDSVLYPRLPNYLFAALTTFDKKRFPDLGVETDRTYVLPNPVVLSNDLAFRKTESRKAGICSQLGISAKKLLITYPVRVIQRKNIGEFILLCCLLHEKASWVVTQPPKNPSEVVHYMEWKDFCMAQNIPIVFEAGQIVGFEELISASDWCVTTSIREGFGMVFLEPWLLGTPVAGRDLKNTTGDLKESGIQFPLLYDALWVEYEGHKSDFAGLSPDAQRNIMRNLRTSENLVLETIKLNPMLRRLTEKIDPGIIADNRSIILTEYSLSTYAKRIEGIYRKLAG
jgi:glycosyltransferase involved in cell wall biosynthesis